MAEFGQKIDVVSTVKIKKLIYDIENETYLRGRTIQNKDNHKEVASMQASDDAENLLKLLRSITSAFATVKTELGEYLDEDGTTTDNKPVDGTSDLVLNLKMPSNFNRAATAGIANAIHEYIKHRAVAEWYTVTNKADAETYFSLANESLQRMLQTVSKRSRPEPPTD